MRTAYPAPTSFLGVIGQNDMDTGMMFGMTFDNANKRLAMCFVAIGNRTLSKVRVKAGRVQGTIGTSDLVCELYATGNDCKPTGSALATASTVTPAVQGNGDRTFTISGFSYALTSGTLYALVFRNANGTPATNVFYVDAMKAGQTLYKNGRRGAVTFESTDAGSTWTQEKGGASNMNIEYSDGSTQGLCFEFLRYPGQGGYQIYGARECGAKFTIGSVPIRIVGGASHVYYVGVPTGNVRMRLYQDTTLIATSNSHTYNSIGYYPANPFFFDDEIQLEPGVTYRLVTGETTNSDTSANRYDVSNAKVSPDTENRYQLPFSGTWQGTFFDGSVWTDSNTEISSCALILAEPMFGTPSGFSARGGSALNGGMA